MTEPQPFPALDAARQLAAEGHHVHYVAHGQAVCLTGRCSPQQP